MNIRKLFRRYKFKLMFILCAAFIIAVILALFSVDNTTNNKNVSYITSNGWEVKTSPAEIAHIRLPEDFNSLYRTYNALAAADGINLESYCGKNVTRYSYTVTNHTKSESADVRANIYVYKSEIIAADISVLSPEGTTLPIKDTSGKKQP